MQQESTICGEFYKWYTGDSFRKGLCMNVTTENDKFDRTPSVTFSNGGERDIPGVTDADVSC